MMAARTDGVRFYIPNLPETVTDEEIGANFARFGTVLEASVARDKMSGMSRGFGYVTLQAGTNPDVILNEVHYLGGMGIRVLLTKESLAGSDGKKVHLSNCLHLTPDQIRDAFSQFGQVWDVHTPKDPNTGERKKFGFVTFGSDEGFNNACSVGSINVGGIIIEIRPASQSGGKGGKGDCWGGKGGGDTWGGGGSWGGCGMSWGGDKGGWGGDKGGFAGGKKGGGKKGPEAELRKVHIDNCHLIPPEVIQQAFSQFGPVVDVHTPKDPNSGERRKFAFVTFGTDEALNAAINTGAIYLGNETISIKMASRSAGAKGFDKGMGWGGGKGCDAWSWGGCGKGGDSWGGKGDMWSAGAGKGGWGGKAGGKDWGGDWGCGKGMKGDCGGGAWGKCGGAVGGCERSAPYGKGGAMDGGWGGAGDAMGIGCGAACGGCGGCGGCGSFGGCGAGVDLGAPMY